MGFSPVLSSNEISFNHGLFMGSWEWIVRENLPPKKGNKYGLLSACYYVAHLITTHDPYGKGNKHNLIIIDVSREFNLYGTNE